MDLAKKDRSWQDTGMSYGALFRQVAALAGAGVLYPSYLDSRPLGIPRVQYQETDWEFLKRMAGHFGLPLYPEPTGGGARVSVGIPETGAPVELDVDGVYGSGGGEQPWQRPPSQLRSGEQGSPCLRETDHLRQNV